MASELVTAGVGLAGVALGSIGTLAAAYIQRKGSQDQAEATYRAAVTTARTQYAGALEAQNRAAQRNVYVSFVTAARAFQRAARGAVLDVGAANLDPLRGSVGEFRTAFGAVELEGPTSVLTAANEVLRMAELITITFHHGARIMEAERILEAPRDTTDAHWESSDFALRTLREVHRIRLEATPDELVTLNMMQAREDAEAGRSTRAVTWLRALERARSAMGEVGGLLDRHQASDLLFDVELRSPGPLERAQSVLNEFDAAIAAFVHAARSYLNDTQPDIGQPGPR
ncbi:hypothetical protein OG426_54535 (plasmid) [Streptomyces canus]|uniref:hypothetical protein n=1 Tax=Streptomyces canus TaxID=58343 RepID=UPI00386ADD24|nr:hypothetical protein OG426_54535 [Streptomyces canus]